MSEVIAQHARELLRPGIQRGLDFVRLDALRKRTGVPQSDALAFALRELLFNALDKEDATEIRIVMSKSKETLRLTVSDNGSQKLSQRDLEFILNFDNEASSKRGFFRVSRGYLGNALKCILGYSFVLGGSLTIFESGPSRFAVRLIPDWSGGRIDYELKVEKRKDDGFTTVSVNFPNQEELLNTASGPIKYQDLILATSYVNPDRKLSFDIFGVKGVCQPLVKQYRKKHGQETSILWYTLEEFEALVNDYSEVAPDMNLRHFLNLFRGMSSKNIQKDIIAEVGKKRQKASVNLDMRKDTGTAFFTISKVEPKALFQAMRKRCKPAENRSIPSALGCVGLEVFKKLGEQNGWTNLRYAKYAGNRGSCDEWHDGIEKLSRVSCKGLSHKEYPWFLEVAVYDRGKYKDKAFEPFDTEGPKIYYCVNFAATEHDTFREIFDISGHLGRAGLRDQSVTVITHYVSPVLFWLNYGKSSLGE